MRKERKDINLASIQLNTGQLDWLPANPRTWTQSDIDDTRDSILEDPDFLEDRPILVVPFGKEFVAFGGNLRREGAYAAKMSKVPCVVYLDPQTEEDYETILRRAMKDNGQFGKTDWNAVYSSKWGTLPLEKWGLTPKGWTSPEGEGVNGGGGEPVQPIEAHEDDFSEEEDAIKGRCKPGDIWQLGEHRLICGDSTDLEVVKKVMGGVKADMVFTDPPYGVAIGDKNKVLHEVVGGNQVTENLVNDTLPVDALYTVLRQAMENVRLNTSDDACYFVTSPPGGEFGLMMMMMQDAGLKVRHQIVWNKNSATFSLGRLDYDYKHEAIMYTWTKKRHNYRGGAFRTSVWDIDKPRKCDLHPTMKPVELVANCILDGTKEGDVVLDAFGGSGTTLIAAEQMGRKACLVEIDPHYCDVILARWEKLTGRKADKVNN